MNTVTIATVGPDPTDPRALTVRPAVAELRLTRRGVEPAFHAHVAGATPVHVRLDADDAGRLRSKLVENMFFTARIHATSDAPAWSARFVRPGVDESWHAARRAGRLPLGGEVAAEVAADALSFVPSPDIDSVSLAAALSTVAETRSLEPVAADGFRGASALVWVDDVEHASRVADAVHVDQPSDWRGPGWYVVTVRTSCGSCDCNGPTGMFPAAGLADHLDQEAAAVSARASLLRGLTVP